MSLYAKFEEKYIGGLMDALDTLDRSNPVRIEITDMINGTEEWDPDRHASHMDYFDACSGDLSHEAMKFYHAFLLA